MQFDFCKPAALCRIELPNVQECDATGDDIKYSSRFKKILLQQQGVANKKNIEIGFKNQYRSTFSLFGCICENQTGKAFQGGGAHHLRIRQYQ